MEEFVAKHLALLAKEHEAELAESSCLLSNALQNPRELEAKGVCLTKLRVASQEVGLYGRQVVGFERAGRGKKTLPGNCIKPGDILGVFASGRGLGSDRPLSGVVTRCTDTVCVLAFEDLPDQLSLGSHDGSLQLVRLANEITYKRLKQALEGLHQIKSSHLASVLFNETPPSLPDPKWSSADNEDSSHSFINPLLDPSQQRAVLFAMSRPDVAIIHGPPGTGKTTTVIEIILQCVKLRQKVLACAPSNIAVDNMVERLASHSIKVVRLGHPARLVSSVMAHSLDSLLSSSDSATILQDCRKDLTIALSKAGKARDVSVRRRWRGEVKELRKELIQRQSKLIKEILRGADVILATNTGLSPDGPLKHLPKDFFNVVVIDECAQALEVSCWIPLRYSTKCVLAGDHKQLPPTILSNEAAAGGLSVTLMERLVEQYGDHITAMLTTQYRMHQKIMEWPSKSLYNSCLLAHHTVASHLLKDLPGVVATPDTSTPLLFIDTAGCSIYERETESDEGSKGNEGEADIVVLHVKSLLDAGVPAKSVAVIAPYNLQVDLIRQSLARVESEPGYHGINQLEVRTVDGFQGREKDAVIISFTRSNTKGEYGFLREQRRTNVAVTRARRHLALVGDSSTISNEPFISGLLDHCSQCGEIRTAHEYFHDICFESTPITSVSKHKKDAKIQSTPISHVIHGKEHRHTRKDQLDMAADAELRKNFRPQYSQQLTEFIAGDQATLTFPCSLTSHHRKIIHELAEEMGLVHSSKGEGKERCIMVEKSKSQVEVAVDDVDTTGPPANEYNSKKDEDENLDEQEELRDEDMKMIVEEIEEEEDSYVPYTCEFCGRQIPLPNIELHKLRCTKRPQAPVLKDIAAQGGGDSASSSQSVAKASGVKTSRKVSDSKDRHTKPKPAASKKKGKGGANKIDDCGDDIDSLLAEMKISDERCKYQGCRKSTNLLSMRCQFCGARFCFGHSLAENHGCGDAAKRHARQQISKELQRGSRAAAKPVNPTQKAQLQKQLERKIGKLSHERQRKRPSDNS